ncbi:MAG: hypothetical protein H0W90_08280 [Actinobacteria bacterium]|nr:hypothetical protein [Actinomycetota bacterium]
MDEHRDDERLESEPDLGEEIGKLPITNEHGETVGELPVDKRELYGAIATRCGGLEHVTELHVENAGGNWLEFGQYIAEMLRDQERRLWIMEQECRTLGIDPATIYANWTKDRLGFWHSPPGPSVTTGETASSPEGRPAPPDTGWGD